MKRPSSRVLLCFLCVLALATSVECLAASLREQRDDLRRASSQLKAAMRLAERDRGEDALGQYNDAVAKIQGVGKELDPKLTRTYDRAAKFAAETQQALAKLGVAAQPPEALTPSMATPPEAGPARRGRFERGEVSFVTQVAPLLVRRCGRCHVDGARGEFSLASYNALMRGSSAGRVLVPGEGTGGVLMDNLESGAMPPGGQTMPPEEMTLISRWITQGARFDGGDPDANLKDLKPGAAPPPRPEQPMTPPQATRPTGAETVSFALDVAPLLERHCSDCHVNDNRGQLRFATFRQLLNSSTVTPGQPDASELVRRLRPDADRRMPQGRPPLSEQEIATIASWVREGAKFDGQTPTEPLARSTSFVRAERATPEELTAMRRDAAAANWRLGIPDEAAHQHSTDRFLVVGSLSEARLQQIGAAAEQAADQAQQTLSLTPGGGIGKAKQTLFAFDHAIDYREFVLMVERRQAGDATGHARFDPVDPYACLVAPDGAPDADRVAIAKQVAALVAATHAAGGGPDWYIEGVARYAAAKAHPKDPLVRRWMEALPDAAAALSAPDAFMTGAAPPEQAGVAAMHFVAGMARNGRSFHGLLDDLSEGEPFDAAFARRYKATPGELADRWLQSLKRRR